MSLKKRSARLQAFVTVTTFASLGLACIGDENAPDCFYPDGNGGCLTPPILDISLNCDDIPDGALRATYGYTAIPTGGTGSCDADGLCTGYRWTITGLPPGVTADESTGRISGVPTELGDYTIEITAGSSEAAGSDTVSCPMTVNPALNVESLRNTSKHCLEVGQDINDFLAGGDGTAFTCAFPDRNPDQASCPHGDGNGVLPDGIALDFADGGCSHSGTVTEDAFGSWVWVVELSQSDYSIFVPFCATNDTVQGHDLTVNYSQSTDNTGLEPAYVEFQPGVGGSFGNNSDPNFEVLGNNGLCTGTGCAYFAFAFEVTCSPLDPPFTLDPAAKVQDGGGADIGFTHEMHADFPSVAQTFEERVFATNWSIDYCNSMTADPCSDANLSTNAQTHFNYTVVGWPAPN